MLILKVASNRQCFFREAFKKKKKKSLMLKKRDGRKRAPKVKNLIWNTNKKDWKKTKSKTWRWWKEVSEKGDKSRGKDDREAREWEERRKGARGDAGLWMAEEGESVYSVCPPVCVCVRRGCSLLTPCVTTGSALGKYKHPGRSEGDGESRERQRRERWRKWGQPQVYAAADVYVCVCVCICGCKGQRPLFFCFSSCTSLPYFSHEVKTAVRRNRLKIWQRDVCYNYTKRVVLGWHGQRISQGLTVWQ